jgi:RNA polymerase sigma-70 factor (ECF subfamily)
LNKDRQLERPADGPSEPVPLSDPEFKDQLAAVIPHLRAFGRSLSGSRDLADDLVQETLLKAWAARKRFQAGTNMRAWTFIILRNLFLSQMRRAREPGPAHRARRHAARFDAPAAAAAGGADPRRGWRLRL